MFLLDLVNEIADRRREYHPRSEDYKKITEIQQYAFAITKHLPTSIYMNDGSNMWAREIGKIFISLRDYSRIPNLSGNITANQTILMSS